jgi:hypothetical protein
VSTFERDVTARLQHLVKTARMWGSPDELEAAALHLVHVRRLNRDPRTTLDDTFAFWRTCGGPFADDPDEHARMRTQLFGADDALARGQVLTGFAVVWTTLERNPEREAAVAPWLETLLDDPTPAGTPDRLNAVLFTLMGFVAAQPERYVEALSAERARIGGHALRPPHVVAPPGPVEAALGWTRTFPSFDRVGEGLLAVQRALAVPPT